MATKLPLPVTNYFVGKNTRDFATALSGFATSAVVRDETHSHIGHDAILAWMQETVAKYDDKADVIGVTKNEPDEIEVEAKVRGTFPGSPITLRFKFTLGSDLISELAIGS